MGFILLHFVWIRNNIGWRKSKKQILYLCVKNLLWASFHAIIFCHFHTNWNSKSFQKSLYSFSPKNHNEFCNSQWDKVSFPVWESLLQVPSLHDWEQRMKLGFLVLEVLSHDAIVLLCYCATLSYMHFHQGAVKTT